jgi:peptidoglycan/xylan/chitin deacetylase (PgdA/CDA1 family)
MTNILWLAERAAVESSRTPMNGKFKSPLRLAALHVARTLGGFALAQHLTRNRLRIICYHGFSLGDEHEVAPHMFMRPETFQQRMKILRRRRVPVIPLDDAVRKLRNGGIRNAETVITLDDGWASSLIVAAPILEEFGYPACIYITTEHLAAGTEVFNVILSYILCRSRGRTLRLEKLHPDLDGTYEIGDDTKTVTTALINAAERAFPQLSDRQLLLRPISMALGMDLDQILVNNRFRLLRRSEIEELFRRGFDIQLHTHTHSLPDSSFEAMATEIVRNRDALKEVLGRVQSHFCYPSGRYAGQHLEWLARLGISSATTCDPGLNCTTTPVLLLRRYLDSDQSSDIEFEAEICGLRDLARAVRAHFLRPGIAVAANYGERRS